MVKGISTSKKVSRCHQAQILFDGASAAPPLWAIHVDARVAILTDQEQLQNVYEALGTIDRKPPQKLFKLC